MVGGPTLAATVAAILLPFVAMGGIWLIGRYLLGDRGDSGDERNVPDSVNQQARTIPGGSSD